MRKFCIVLLMLTPIFSLAACKQDRICIPYSVRQDSYQPDRWWVCNSDGTMETSVQSPVPAGQDPIKVEVKTKR